MRLTRELIIDTNNIFISNETKQSPEYECLGIQTNKQIKINRIRMRVRISNERA